MEPRAHIGEVGGGGLKPPAFVELVLKDGQKSWYEESRYGNLFGTNDVSLIILCRAFDSNNAIIFH